MRQVSELNNELKLNGFTVFQIECDDGAVASTAGKIFIKYVCQQERVSFTMLIEALKRREQFCFLAIRTYLIPGKCLYS